MADSNVVTFLPIQEGEGDPSPTNVRPIKPPLYLDEIGPVYGGELNVETGKLIETWQHWIEDGSRQPHWWIWKKYEENHIYIGMFKPFNAENRNYVAPNSRGPFPISSKRKYVGVNGSGLNNPSIFSQYSLSSPANGASFVYSFAGEEFATKTKEEMATYLSQNPIEIVYPLTSSTMDAHTYYLTPAQLNQAIEQLGIQVPSAIEMRRRVISAQRGLPPSYKKIEYLESNGTQYIMTDIPARYGIECSSTIMWTAGSDSCIFGGRKRDSDRIMLIHQYPKYKWTLGYGVANSNLAIFNYNQKYKVSAKVYPGEQWLDIDGERIYTGNNVNEYNNNFNMALFGCTNEKTENVSLKAYAKIYDFKAMLDGRLALNFIPCIRKADNKPGMFDAVHQKFYTNAGTGEFIVPT